MSLYNQINTDFMEAFKAREKTKKDLLGLIKGEIQSLGGKGLNPSDENVLAIIKKLEKSLKTSAENGDKAAEVELTFLEPYLPKQMDEAEIRNILSGYIDNGADNIGFLMGSFNRDHNGKADNKLVAQIAKQLLA